MADENSEVTRRQLAVALAGAASALAQAPATSADNLPAIREQRSQNLAQIRAVAIPVATEPSFTFKP